MDRFPLHLMCWFGSALVAPEATAAAIESWALLDRPRMVGPTTLFETIPPGQSGIDIVHELPRGAPPALVQEQGSGAGVAAGDFDGDGRPDLFVTNYDRGCRLYRNLGGWRFQDVTDKAGVRAAGRWCAGATFCDVDNDGDLDLHVCCFNSPNLLFLNQGNGGFSERARELGLDWTGASVMAAFADYDLDGRLDVFLLTHRDAASAGQRLPLNTRNAADRGVIRRDPDGRPEVTPTFRDLFTLLDKGGGRLELVVAGQPDQLFRQGTNGVFRNVTERSGIRGHDIGLGVGWWDYNADGRPDVYVANDHKTPDRLWRNNGDGTFTDVAPSVLPFVPLASMGTDTADVDNDGLIDLLATEMAGSNRTRRMVVHQDFDKNEWIQARANPPQLPRNALFLGARGEQVLEVARLAGLHATDWTWSPKFGDFDNDGWVDLFIANGMSHDYVHEDLLARMSMPKAPAWRDQPPLRERNLAFRNRGNLQFDRVESAWGVDSLSASFGACVADFDGDGNLDLAVMNLGEPIGLHRNRESVGHRVVIRLKGTRANAWGIGSVVHAETSHGTQTRCLQLASGFLSANEPLVHFGLGAETRLSRLTVRWPGGAVQSFEDLEADRFYTVTEPGDRPAAAPAAASAGPRFRRSEAGAGMVHRERPFDDFAREPLLPMKLSQLGPGLAVGDIDGDGDDDLYLGGAAGQPGMIGVHEGDGRFRVAVSPDFERDRESEDMGALFLDADGDGDLDLFVVSGGAECEPDSPTLADRLYLNDGKGAFTSASPGTIPVDHDSGSVVCAADFDRDGDLDLFVGGRLVPGKYLAPPRSRLLLNQGGRFIEAPDARAPGLDSAGLVTSALWTDVDDDGWIDLVVASEWGTLQLFRNRAGRLAESDRESGFAGHSGLWQGLAVADVNGDGHLDLVATNLGLNGPYPTATHGPISIWRGEFEEGAPGHLIQAHLENGIRWPLRRREFLSAALPSLAARFPTYEAYAHAPLAEVIPTDRLAGAARFDANTLESGLWLNDGQGHFTFSPLPRLAQIAPGFGVIARDLDGDGIPDLAIVQNLRGTAPDLGPLGRGAGLVLRGRKGAGLDLLAPAESGWNLPEDYRGLAVLDLGADHVPVLAAARNDGALVLLRQEERANPGRVTLRFRGPTGNPTAVGARVEVRCPGAPIQVAEVQAGGGYLSQSSASLHFGCDPGGHPLRILVRWPDGTRSESQAPAGVHSLTIDHPGAPEHNLGF